MRSVIFLCGLLLTGLSLIGQSTDSLRYTGPEINILVHNGVKVDLPSDTDQQFTDKLDARTSMHIRSQGPSFLTTALYRGQSARHMAILWEGINIQNTLNGTYDLRLIPGSIYNRSSWYAGGQSASVGSSSLAGAIQLGSKAMTGLEVGLVGNTNSKTSSNIGYDNLYLKLGQIDSNQSHQLSIQHINRDNYFPYHLGTESLRRTDHQHKQFDIDYQLSHLWSDHHSTRAKWWYQDAERQLPFSILGPNGFAIQSDVNQRMSLSHYYSINPDWNMQLSYTYMDEYISYQSDAVDSRASTYVHQTYGSIAKQGLWNHTLAWQARWDHADANFYNEGYSRAIYSAIYNTDYQSNNSRINISARLELLDNDLQAPNIQASYTKTLSPQWKIGVDGGMHYQYPLFNDLYWPQDGNPDLMTERSYQLSSSVNRSGTTVSVYYIHTRDKIVWSPNDIGVWSPDNQDQTRAYGLEIETTLNHTFRNALDISIIPSYFLTVAKNIHEEDRFNGKQLIYTPKHKSSIVAEITWGVSSLLMNWTCHSTRYTNSDNSTALDPYQILNMTFKYRLPIWSDYRTLDTFIRVNNLTNTSYELEAYFPQSQRFTEFGLKYKLNKKQIKQIHEKQ